MSRVHQDPMMHNLGYDQPMQFSPNYGNHVMGQEVQGIYPAAPSYQYVDAYGNALPMPYHMTAGQPDMNIQSSPIPLPPGQHPLPSPPPYNRIRPQDAPPQGHISDRTSPTPELNGPLPSASPTPEDCGSEAPVLAVHPSMAPGIYDTEVMSLDPSAQALSAANFADSALIVNQQDKGKGRGTEVSMDAVETMINDAPQTTIYSMPSTLATAENPMTSHQSAQLQASGSWRAQQVPRFAAEGIIGSAAQPGDSIEVTDNLYECPCGDGCACVFCSVHPHNEASVARAQEMGRLMLEPNAPTASGSPPQFLFDEMANPVTAHGDHTGSQDNQADEITGHLGYGPTDGLFSEQMSMEPVLAERYIYHESRKQNATLSVIQRKHFARARGKLLNGRPPLQQFDIAIFHDVEADNTMPRDTTSAPDLRRERPSTQMTLEEFESLRPVVKQLQSLRPHHSPKHSSPAQTQLRCPEYHPSKKRQTNKAGSYSSISVRGAEQSIIEASTTPIVSDELEVKRQELLNSFDWVGLEKMKPAQMKFADAEDRDLIGKRRLVPNNHNIKKPMAQQHRRPPNNACEKLNMARASSNLLSSSGKISIHIGSSHRGSSTGWRQNMSSNGGDDRQAHASDEMLFDDQEASKGSMGGSWSTQNARYQSTNTSDEMLFDPRSSDGPSQTYLEHTSTNQISYRQQPHRSDPEASVKPLPQALEIRPPSPEQKGKPQAQVDTTPEEDEILWRTFVFGTEDPANDWTFEKPITKPAMHSKPQRTNTSSPLQPISNVANSVQDNNSPVARSQPSLLVEASPTSSPSPEDLQALYTTSLPSHSSGPPETSSDPLSYTPSRLPHPLVTFRKPNRYMGESENSVTPMRLGVGGRKRRRDSGVEGWDDSGTYGERESRRKKGRRNWGGGRVEKGWEQEGELDEIVDD
ncbi:MAG: hypothetical protein Q9171_005764 [Xanthocarpia ochracea]